MKKVNDFIVYGTRGVFKIIDIEQDETDSEKGYYVLKQVDGSMVIKTPVNNSKVIRDVLTESEVNELIEGMPEVEPIWLNDSRKRSLKFREMIESGKTKDLIKVVKTLYLKNKELTENYKKMTFRDKELLNDAQKLLYAEFGFALNIPSDQVEEYILERVS
ncbi:CarD family transcriptional regulator [Haloplasma contractile]|uniref:Transcriptional regulator protein n=1 Tax=Haloplasma contractile SSD-17B TaxID=1033810 RepID=F7Q1U5_9MOLU|nr:CarD family transcriptional regulator [Haloplasma contractile]ERJ12244.1 transcriptional regulator protein [Haloplasma contractile SSD-17B]